MLVQIIRNFILMSEFYWILSKCLELQQCYGGDSVRGLLDLEKKDEVICCDNNGCQGYRVDVLHNLLNGSLELPAKTQVRSNRIERSSASANPPVKESGSDKLNIPCCSSNVTVVFPVSGISATTMQRVLVLQLPAQFQQPVVYRKCSEDPCRLLRGNCTQVYVPQQLYTINLGTRSNVTSANVVLDYVFVESGCECKIELQQSTSGLSHLVSVDPVLTNVFEFLTKKPVSLQDLSDAINQSPGIRNRNSSIVPVTEKVHDVLEDKINVLETSVVPDMSWLPLPGYPVRIPEGFFNPVLTLVTKYHV